MYCEYWNLNKPPFDNVPDPSMYVDCHASMENVISETIFAIKEANECFAVIIGDVGLGKTLSLRIIIDSLEPNKYKIALITNPSISFAQLLREIIGQITGKQCEENTKVNLLEIFNHLLFEVIDQGRKIVIFIDEANAISPANLENLRLLTNMQDDKRNLFTLVLAGQMELARRLEHPKRANLFQRIGTYGRIDKLPSEESVKTYIETRLKLAGAQRKFFNEDCIPVIWEASDHGIPRLINKICKLCLKAGETNEFRIITPEVTTQIADRFQKLSQVALQKRKPRNRPDFELTEDEISMLEEMEELEDISETTTVQETESKSPIAAEEIQQSPQALTSPETATQGSAPAENSEERSKAVNQQETDPRMTLRKIDGSTISLNKPIEYKSEPKSPIAAENLKEITQLQIDRLNTLTKKFSDDSIITLKKLKETEVEEEVYDEVQIGSHKVILTIPKHIIKQAASSDRERANKMAGYLAAQILKNNQQLISSPLIDPVTVWNEIRDLILIKMSISSTSNSNWQHYE
jgi:type II secretory pathway predicted ATPase ExeA